LIKKLQKFLPHRQALSGEMLLDRVNIVIEPFNDPIDPFSWGGARGFDIVGHTVILKDSGCEPKCVIVVLEIKNLEIMKFLTIEVQNVDNILEKAVGTFSASHCCDKSCLQGSVLSIV